MPHLGTQNLTSVHLREYSLKINLKYPAILFVYSNDSKRKKKSITNTTNEKIMKITVTDTTQHCEQLVASLSLFKEITVTDFPYSQQDLVLLDVWTLRKIVFFIKFNTASKIKIYKY